MWKPDYITLSELKDVIDVDDVIDDVFLSLVPNAASRAVDRACGRQFGSLDAPVERFYPVKYSASRRRYVAAIDDLQDVTGLVLPSGVDSYRLEPRNAVTDGYAFTHITFPASPLGTDEDEFGMTARWGWTSGFPDAVKMATFLQGNRWSSRKDSPFGISGSPDQGGELRLLERVDPDVRVSLRDYRRDWWAA